MLPFPVMLDLSGRRCLVVGGDDDAVARVEKLVQAGATVLVLLRPPADEPERLCTLAAEGSVHIERRPASPEDIDGAALAIVATSEEAQAPPLYARAVQTGRLLCTVDRPELSTFIHPAVARAGPLAVAVSTGGASPALARRIREDLEALFSEPHFVAWISAIADERATIPRGERAARGAEAVRGFAIEARLVLPEGAKR
jgi:precorrin-2 dehydrogenase/sirohydrochlorin ferrochelatase